jgi:serine/threonine protein kinase
MGEVYQALDTKLGRSVAVKVLPENLALDPERISRFQREAKLLASPITKTLLRCMDWSKRAADIFW